MSVERPFVRSILPALQKMKPPGLRSHFPSLGRVGLDPHRYPVWYVDDAPVILPVVIVGEGHRNAGFHGWNLHEPFLGEHRHPSFEDPPFFPDVRLPVRGGDRPVSRFRQPREKARVGAVDMDYVEPAFPRGDRSAPHVRYHLEGFPDAARNGDHPRPVVVVHILRVGVVAVDGELVPERGKMRQQRIDHDFDSVVPRDSLDAEKGDFHSIIPVSNPGRPAFRA